MDIYQQPGNKGKKSTWFSRRNIFIIVVVIVAILVTIAWILSILGVIPAVWATIITAIVTLTGVLITFIQFFIKFETHEHHPAPPIQPPETFLPPANTTAVTHRGIMGVPPATSRIAIQPRENVVKEVYRKLIQPDTTAVVLTGIGGIGKSTLAALVARYAEEQRLSGKGPFTDQVLWLRVDAAADTGIVDLMGTLLGALGKPLPNISNLTPANQIATLFNALNTVDKPRLIVLDQFETLLDGQTGHARADRPAVGELIDAFNNQPCRCRILLTSRLWPRGTYEAPAAGMQEQPIQGLELAEGIALLRNQGVMGTDQELSAAVKRCSGHALSLTLLASLLRSNPSLSLQALFSDPTYAQLWIGGTGNVARNLLDYIYTRQLDETQRQLLLAFSIYREPVPLAAAQPLLNLKIKLSEDQLFTPLEVLLAQHLLQAAGSLRYQLHAIVASYAHDHFDDRSKEANRRAQLAAHAKAAQYYVQQAANTGRPHHERRRVSDVQMLIEATWHFCQAEQWQEAFNLMQREQLFVDLNRWGGKAILLELCLLLLTPGKWQPKPIELSDIYYYLGWAYDDLGQQEEALRYYQQALTIDKEIGDRQREGTTLNNLGRMYGALNQNSDALRYYQEALAIYREVHDRIGEGTTLNNLGSAYSAINQTSEALYYFQESLKVTREIKDRWVEGTTLGFIGRVYDDTGRQQEALEYYAQGLAIYREVGDRGGEASTLWNIGALYFRQDKYEVALACFLLARDIFEEVLSPKREGLQWWIDDLRRRVGEKEFVASVARITPRAEQLIEEALARDVH